MNDYSKYLSVLQHQAQISFNYHLKNLSKMTRKASNFLLQSLFNLDLNLCLCLFLKWDLSMFSKCLSFRWLLGRFKNRFCFLTVLIWLNSKYLIFWATLMNFQNLYCSSNRECNSKLPRVVFSQVYTKIHWSFTFNGMKLTIHHQEHELFKTKAKSFDKDSKVHLLKFQVFKVISRYWLHQVLCLNASHLYRTTFTFSKLRILLFKAFFSSVINIKHNIKSIIKCPCNHMKTSFFSEFPFEFHQCTSNCSWFGCSLHQKNCLLDHNLGKFGTWFYLSLFNQRLKLQERFPSSKGFAKYLLFDRTYLLLSRLFIHRCCNMHQFLKTHSKIPVLIPEWQHSPQILKFKERN